MDQAGPLDGNGTLTSEDALLAGKRKLVQELAGKYTPEEIRAVLKELRLAYTLEGHDSVREALEKHWDKMHDVVEGEIKSGPGSS